ncbi:LamG-like jellyroll fold domain-containing protein [Adhaeretor mobilis]|uniref:FecR protein n=1 Tax=Adhaeretor mobilis TaxID=1930276 RepID=A0A517MUB4_9BACT|nr:LamG-like jellyroll fold domain-containing protein [Adhaeretor mobilis]QDS98476.1 FecR protein [Adhaeretor mobilis]
MNKDLNDLIFSAIDQSISPADFDRLQDAIEKDDLVRNEYLRALNLSEILGELATEERGQLLSGEGQQDRSVLMPSKNAWSLPVSALWLTLAASLLLLVGGIAFTLGHGSGSQHTAQLTPNDDYQLIDQERTIAGYATLRNSVDIEWSAGATSYRDGDVLSAGILEFEKGIVEIDFFCGARLLVEGPAKMKLESDWSVRFLKGRLLANVPPAARGFTVKTADSEIFDLGTEFSLNVDSEHARVEVLNGEVELRGGEHHGNHLVTGQSSWLKGEGDEKSLEAFSTVKDFRLLSEAAKQRRFKQWKSYSEKRRLDERLIAYYPIPELSEGRMIRNAASDNEQRDGALVGMVSQSAGRFGSSSPCLGFHRPGSRVRVMIDGEYSAFTFTCWAKIDSLEHRYNALFLTDGYENGEPHWQVLDDGRLMFSVMVDDTQEIQRPKVKDAGLHEVYYSEPIWDVTMSGQWIHLASVYDPARREVSHYLNGEQVSSQEITDEYYIKKLRIGPAEIGNWGQPFRKTPWFSVRNLQGMVDELAIYNAALADEEIEALYEQGKPLGY